MPCVLGHVGVGAGHEHRPARLVRLRRPHLLAVDHPLVAVAHRPGGRAPARSDPAPGSLNSWHQTSSPVHSGRSQRCCCSSVPCARIVGAAMPRPIPMRRGLLSGTPAAREFCVHRRLRRAGRPGRRARPGSAPRPARRRSEPAGTASDPRQELRYGQRSTRGRGRSVRPRPWPSCGGTVPTSRSVGEGAALITSTMQDDFPLTITRYFGTGRRCTAAANASPGWAARPAARPTPR